DQVIIQGYRGSRCVGGNSPEGGDPGEGWPRPLFFAHLSHFFSPSFKSLVALPMVRVAGSLLSSISFAVRSHDLFSPTLWLLRSWLSTWDRIDGVRLFLPLPLPVQRVCRCGAMAHSAWPGVLSVQRLARSATSRGGRAARGRRAPGWGSGRRQ